MFARLKSLFPDASAGEARELKKRADEHLRNDRFGEAAQLYRQALAIDPGNGAACVGLGFTLSEQRQYDEAERHLRHALAIEPGNADAYYTLGTIAKNRRDLPAAIEHFTRALEIKSDFEFAYRDLFAALAEDGQTQRAREVLERALVAFPDSASFHACLGNLLNDEKRVDEAVACYQRALSIEPDFVVWRLMLAGALRSQGKGGEAATHYQQAIFLQPDLAPAHLGLGNLFESQGKLDEAISCYRRAIAIDGRMIEAHQYLGNLLLKQGATREAVTCYENIVRIDPSQPLAHLITALSGGDSERAPSEYIEDLFDQYARIFDSHLVNTLRYNVPDEIAALLRQYRQSDDEKWIVLDLGCGTGLSGAAMSPFAGTLVGVDLSANMLEKARARGLYDRLIQLDLLTMMKAEETATYDVILAADVLVYLGKLDELAREAHRLLRVDGLFAFSVESLEALNKEPGGSHSRDYQLNATGRYAHSIDYLSRVAMESGFGVLITMPNHIRLDKDNSVYGYLAVWRRTPAG